MDWQIKTPLNFDIKFHDSYLMKCLHNNITQDDTIWLHLYLPHQVSNIKTTSNQCYTLYVTLLRILIHTEENPYGMSIHAGDEPYIYGLIVVSFVKNQVHKNNPLSNLLGKINYFVHRELMMAKLLPIQCLNYLCSFYSVKLILIFIKNNVYTLAGCVF